MLHSYYLQDTPLLFWRARHSLFSSKGTEFQELFAPGRVSILLLRDLDPQLRGLVIGYLTKRIIKLRGISCECEKRARIKLIEADRTKEKNSDESNQLRQEAEMLRIQAKKGLTRGWILIDEAHNYIPQVGIIGSKIPLRRFVNEGRNLGLSIAVTTQQPSALDSSIRRNADILIVHAISMKGDIDVTEKMLNTAVPSDIEMNKKIITGNVFDRMVRGLPTGYAIISAPNASRVFLSKIRPRASTHGGTDY